MTGARTRRSEAGQTRRQRRQWRTEADKKVNTTNTNLGQGETADAEHTATSYFDPGCNAFAQYTVKSQCHGLIRCTQVVGVGTVTVTTVQPEEGTRAGPAGAQVPQCVYTPQRDTSDSSGTRSRIGTPHWCLWCPRACRPMSFMPSHPLTENSSIMTARAARLGQRTVSTDPLVLHACFELAHIGQGRRSIQ